MLVCIVCSINHLQPDTQFLRERWDWILFTTVWIQTLVLVLFSDTNSLSFELLIKAQRDTPTIQPLEKRAFSDFFNIFLSERNWKIYDDRLCWFLKIVPFSLNRLSGPIQSRLQCVRKLSFCLSLPLWKTHFSLIWKLLVEENIVNIGIAFWNSYGFWGLCKPAYRAGKTFVYPFSIILIYYFY